MSVNAATIFTENFDSSTSLPAGWSSTGAVSIFTDPVYSVSGSNALAIFTQGANTVTTTSLGLTGATEATVSFLWTTDIHSGAFGRIPQIQYSSNGILFSTIGSFTVPANTSSVPAHTLFSETITTVDDGFLFTDSSVFRIVGDNDGGGGGAPLILDNFTVTSNAPIPEPSALLLSGIGAIFLLRRRRP